MIKNDNNNNPCHSICRSDVLKHLVGIFMGSAAIYVVTTFLGMSSVGAVVAVGRQRLSKKCGGNDKCIIFVRVEMKILR